MNGRQDGNVPKEVWPDLTQRVKVIGGFVRLGPDNTVTYTWDHGYEVLEVNPDGPGGFKFVGVYHPRSGLCIGNPCAYCGMVWHADP